MLKIIVPMFLMLIVFPALADDVKFQGIEGENAYNFCKLKSVRSARRICAEGKVKAGLLNQYDINLLWKKLRISTAKPLESPQLFSEAGCSASRPRVIEQIAIPKNMGQEAVRKAILQALTDSWVLEGSNAHIIYAGFYIRTHYLQVAIRYDANTVSIGICDSNNLDMGHYHIHKNALIWKKELGRKISLQLRFPLADCSVSSDPITMLVDLLKQGIITDSEFAIFITRFTKSGL